LSVQRGRVDRTPALRDGIEVLHVVCPDVRGRCVAFECDAAGGCGEVGRTSRDVRIVACRTLEELRDRADRVDDGLEALEVASMEWLMVTSKSLWSMSMTFCAPPTLYGALISFLPARPGTFTRRSRETTRRASYASGSTCASTKVSSGVDTNARGVVRGRRGSPRLLQQEDAMKDPASATCCTPSVNGEAGNLECFSASSWRSETLSVVASSQ